jgi:XTP/dITP diphosphohydrolase
MPKLQRGTKLVVASHNKGKVWEIDQLLAPYGLNAISVGELGLGVPDETETTFAGNARIKALAAARGANLPALADDSGLEVECIGGAPGIYSADWAGPGRDFGHAMQKVGEEITKRHGWSAPGPRANFISVLCLAWPDGSSDVFEGKVFGHLVWPPRGGNGFGYDPIFVPEGETRTYGEMEPKEKYAGSHRTRAFAAFKERCLADIAPASTSDNTGRDLAALTAAAASLSTRDEFLQFLTRLRDDLAVNERDWENDTLPRYLEALQGVTEDTRPDDEPKWRTMAKMLLTASYYE